MDWNLRTCSRKGHVTYAPDEPEFRAKLEAHTPLGAAGAACAAARTCSASRTAPDRPTTRRCCCAARRCAARSSCARSRSSAGCAGSILALLGVAVLRLKSTQVSLQDLFERDLKALEPFFRQIHFKVSDSSTVNSIEKILHAKSSTLNLHRGSR